MIFFKLAWRNIFRNRRRTILSGLAIGIGLASLIFTDALTIGMEQSMIRSATDSLHGHGQIHAEGFRDTLDAGNTVMDLDGVVRRLEEEKTLRNYSVRTLAFAMITSPANVSSVMLYGIDPVREKEVSRIDEAVLDGTYLDDGGSGQILIGSKLAETLEVEVGDRIVITAAQAASGELAQEMFRVTGIFHFNVKGMDSGMGFVHLKKSQELLGLGNNAHEIALSFIDIQYAGDRSSAFWHRFSREGNEALGWRDLMKELDAIIELSQYTKYIVAFILFGIVALIVLNTLFTSLYERLFEFGVLRAVGTRPFGMAVLVMLEALSLSIVSSIMGVVIGLSVSYVFSMIGIDYRGMEFAEVTFQELIYPVINMRQYVQYPLWIMAFALIAGIYPAVFAAKLVPARVLRRSM